MGGLNCKLCDCRDPKTELETRTTLHLAADTTNPSFLTDPSQDFTFEPSSVILRPNELAKVTKIQATWKSYRVQKLMLHVKRSRANNFSYFSSAEVRETLSPYEGPKYRETLTFMYKQGGSYTGEWFGGFRDGHGRMEWPDGAYYEGNWSYSRPAGEGRFRHVDGEEYEGPWTRFPISYREVFISEGDLKTMLSWPFKNGYGKVKSAWLCYKHEFFKQRPVKTPAKVLAAALIKSKLHDLQGLQANLERQIAINARQKPQSDVRVLATRHFENGNYYTGEWSGDLKDGHGKFVWTSGDIYEGEWKNDMQTGWGKSYWAADEASYNGEMRNGRKHGVGEYTWKDGSTYKGQWQLNAMQGHGQYRWVDGRQYLGNWEASKMQGYGIFTWHDGRRYEGAWDNGLKHGPGTFIAADGSSRTEEWEKGRLVS
jgi:hypothetical protein